MVFLYLNSNNLGKYKILLLDQAFNGQLMNIHETICSALKHFENKERRQWSCTVYGECKQSTKEAAVSSLVILKCAHLCETFPLKCYVP